MATKHGGILVVDDNRMNRLKLVLALEQQGQTVSQAENGREALEMIETQAFDLVLLDIVMPEMDGYQLLEYLKSNMDWRDIPVVMISALDEIESAVRCIEMGADDYLPKPFNPVVLKARVNNCLERKRLSDQQKEQKRMLKETFGKYVAREVRDEVLSGRIPLDGEMKEVSVLFADLRDFTPLTESMPPKEVVKILNSYFTEMAPAIHLHHGSILRYVGDEIFAVFGAPIALNHHSRHALETAIEMRQRLVLLNENLQHQGYQPLRHGIGIHSGPVVAANIGSPDRLAYDLVGDTANLASRIQGLTKEFGTDILISATTRDSLDKDFAIEALPATTVKGRRSPVKIFKVA